MSAKRILALLLTLTLASAFFVGLYTFDNKYTHGGLQPANGLIDLTGGELDRVKVHYLIKGWIFYPDALLTPEDFPQGSPDRYHIYVNIGEHVVFDNLGTKDSPHGSGSYVLHLRLPPGRAVYGLELPEIFSAYKLYINGFPYVQMGDPDPAHYEPRTQRRQINFEADGEASILLAVSDQSHFYSGLIYPPAFGTPMSLNVHRGLLLGICVFIDTLALMAALLALYVGVRMREKNSLIFALTCFAMCSFTSYALLHSISLPVFPWYALELTSGYLLTMLVVILQNRICGVGYLTRRISASITGGFSLIALCYGLGASYLTMPVIRSFSMLVVVFKVTSAGYLIVTAALSQRNRTKRTEPLFYATLFYAAASVWDRLLPAYEPMISGWFSEWGSLALVFAIGYTLWRDVVASYAYSLAFAEEHRQVTRQLTMQTEYAKLLAARGEENRRLVHDFRQHLRTMNGLASRLKNPEHADRFECELLEYLEHLAQSVSAVRGSGTPTPAFSENPAADALLQYYYALATEQGMSVDFRLTLPQTLPLNDVELCTMLGNLLENAVEGCQRMKHGPRSITIRTAQTDRRHIIQVNNTFDGQLSRSGERFFSHKLQQSQFGVGLESVREIVQRHGGDLILDPTDYVFSVGISLPIPAPVMAAPV